MLAPFLRLGKREPRKRDGTRAGAPDGFLMTVEEDGIKPGGETAGFVVAGKMFPRAHANLRNEVFGKVEVSGQRRGLPQQTRLQGFD